MRILFAVFTGVLLICSLLTGCSRDNWPGSDKLFERVKKEKEKTARSRQYTRKEEAEREKQAAIADACLEDYNVCLDKCTDTPCEDKCSDTLSLCEKDLFSDMVNMKRKYP